LKEQEEEKAKQEDVMQELQKGLQTIQQECDEAQEALAETNTKLKTTEKEPLMLDLNLSIFVFILI